MPCARNDKATVLPRDLAPAAAPALPNLSSNSLKLLIPIQTGGFSRLRHSGPAQAPELTRLIFMMDLIGGPLPSGPQCVQNAAPGSFLD